MFAAEPVDPIDDAEAATLLSPLADLDRLVLAVSGGPDSMALTVLAARLAKRRAPFPKLLVATVDHGLRPSSAAEAKAVAARARALGLDHRTLAWTGRKPKTGLPAAARAARYRLLAEAAADFGTPHVALAHTLDDQAETVLMRLAAGSGPAGLAAMRAAERRDGLVLHRPLLGIAKARLVATLRRRRVAFLDDPTNADPRFARPRLRLARTVLEREGLTAGRLARLAARLARADEALERAASEAFDRLLRSPAGDGALAFESAGYGRLSDEIALRVLGRAVAQAATEGPVELGKLEALFAALRGHDPLSRRPLRRTLAGALVTASGARIAVEPAPPRRPASRTGGSLHTVASRQDGGRFPL